MTDNQQATATALQSKRFEMLLRAPEDWRQRASAAAGLLTASAAALLVGLLLRPPNELALAARITVVASATFYVAAVISFLIGATWVPYKTQMRDGTVEKVTRRKSRSGDSGDLPQESPLGVSLNARSLERAIYQEVEIQVSPLRLAVRIGRYAALLAVTCTAASTVLILVSPTQSAYVTTLDAQAAATISKACPRFTNGEPAVVTDRTNETITIQLGLKQCPLGPTLITLPATGLALSNYR